MMLQQIRNLFEHLSLLDEWVLLLHVESCQVVVEVHFESFLVLASICLYPHQAGFRPAFANPSSLVWLFWCDFVHQSGLVVLQGQSLLITPSTSK